VGDSVGDGACGVGGSEGDSKSGLIGQESGAD
jgi:hypothetical protein